MGSGRKDNDGVKGLTKARRRQFHVHHPDLSWEALAPPSAGVHTAPAYEVRQLRFNEKPAYLVSGGSRHSPQLDPRSAQGRKRHLYRSQNTDLPTPAAPVAKVRSPQTR